MARPDLPADRRPDRVRHLPALRRRLRHRRHADGGRGDAATSSRSEHGKQVATHLYGQEINAETYAIAKADLLLKGEGEAADNIVGGPEYSTLSNDAFPSREFDFMLSNPPYGKSWKSDLERMGGKDGHHATRASSSSTPATPNTRWSRGPATARCCSWPTCCRKMKHDTPLGSRIAEVHNGSSLFTGDAGQGESNIRRWIIENDWLEAIVALPLNMFYNTGIATYVWVLTNRKPEHRRGKVQLIDATQWFKPLRKNLGKKNCELSDDDIERICDTFLAFEETEQSKIFPNEAFGYWKVTVERPLRLTGIDPSRAYTPKEIKALKETPRHRRGRAAGDPEDPQARQGRPDPLRGLFEATIDGKRAWSSTSRTPTCATPSRCRCSKTGGIEAFIAREVLPHAPDAWYDPDERQDRLRDQLHPLLLQAAAAADAGGDSRGHSGAGEGNGRAARGDHRRGEGMSPPLAHGWTPDASALHGLTPYPTYKDSGLPWVGRVPAHWRIERAKALFRKMERPARESDEVVTCFRDGLVTLRRNRRVRGFTESLKEIGYQGIRRGDLVIHAMDASAGAVGVADSDGKGTPVYSVCQPLALANAHYFAYLVREMARSQWIAALAKGIRERSTDFRFEAFASGRVPLAPDRRTGDNRAFPRSRRPAHPALHPPPSRS